jgi:phage head maturation protease
VEIESREIRLELGVRREGKNRSILAVLSTETPVARRDMYGSEYDEVLRHAEGSINCERFPLPLIESHDFRSLPLGVLENPRIEGSKLRVDVRFGLSARAKEVEADVEEGIIRSLSVGYSVDEFEDKKKQDGSIVRTALKWTPHEGSLVSMPADNGAGFGRSKKMPEKTPVQTPNTPELAERTRTQEITKLSRAANLGEDFADTHVQAGSSVEQTRSAALDAVLARDALIKKPDGVNVSASRDIGGGESILHSRGSEIVSTLLKRSGAGILDVARQCVSNQGGRAYDLSPANLVKRAFSTSDFPALLSDLTNKSLRNGYEAEPASHRSWVRKESVRDFKMVNRPILGSLPSLSHVVQGGEYPMGSMDEDTTGYTVEKYGKIVSLTWEVLVNDDLGSWIRALSTAGQVALRKEADLVYALFAENADDGPTMQDTNELFDSVNHLNVATAGPFNAALLAAGRLLLRKQQALGGGYLALVPRTLLVPAEHEHAAELLLAAASRIINGTNTTTASASVDAVAPAWISGLTLAVEPRLSANAAYLIADHSQVDHCEIGFLEENLNGPVVEEEKSFNVDEQRWKIRHVFGTKFLDWRGIVKMPIS